MMNNNKILTVSYGTFSCTLEGFDDSFGTMKAIAEYFRDLSADDRYFGSEPIQPDAQMLARIAQREISRHVEAREDQGRIVLSAQAGPQAAALVAENTLEDVADAVADATVAKTRETRAREPAPSVAKAAPAPAPADEVDLALPAMDEADTQDDAPDIGAAEPHKTDIVPSLPDEDVDAFFADSHAPAAAQEAASLSEPAVNEATDEEEALLPDRAKADSIADKLKRIRAVVSQQTEAAQEPDYSEDQHAEAATAPAAKFEQADEYVDVDADTTKGSANEVLADTLRDLEEALDADDEFEVEDTAADADEDNEEDDIAALLSRLEEEADDAEPDSGAQAQDEASEELAGGDLDDQDSDDDDRDDDLERNILASIDTIDAGTGSDDLMRENLFEDAEESIEVTDTAPAPDAPKTVAPRTRVLKVKRATLEAAIAAGQLEEYEDDEDAEQADASAQTAPVRKAPLADTSSLTAEAEDELARELAELEADMRSEGTAAATRTETDNAVEPDFDLDYEAFEDDAFSTEDAAFEDVDAPTESEKADTEGAQTARAGITVSTDKDFSRLMEESDHKMDEPEAATRRDAFAHLRAAVAAKKADEAAGDTSQDEETDEAYRDDLADVVRPRRPVAGTDRPRTERPADARPAPLKLVAEQRIDVDPSRSTTPVRPRRVSAVTSVPTAITENTASFADFASEIGAVKLPDLLEAAAAYLSFVEGYEEFSRPQLMTKVRQVEQENFTREDSLRSFGKLLREGKIEKLKGGRFQASDHIGFKPDARAAG